ncbi:hypothetical protein DYB25_008873 [Aphanomyces astaci]|uniref:Uncharacterized protein n=2 Tax=Aphanomyces astaci TaxID=112090 RepID=A0A397CHX1_APHAT|nr:hypothetical protein DYB25_008873 [Aphanomyces astaci]RHY37202.1 hypothetical protein DYB34_007641 [Aphanomyces astaci]RHY46181.1 hypothetical protein DYB30_010861 [Aphanomyces astaci]RHZ32399.1 hypothetical protein DYB26_009462 [Aphanomyces astaci]
MRPLCIFKLANLSLSSSSPPPLMLDPRPLFEYTLPGHEASDVVRLYSPTEERDGDVSSFMVTMAKSCVLLQDAEVISLPCDPSSASLSPDGMVVTGWTSGNTLHAYYVGEAILSRAVDLPSSAWKSFLVKSRVASASLFEFVLLVVCIDGSVCRVRVQSAHDTIQLLAQVSQSHPTLTACDVCDNGRLLVLAGGIRSNAKDMEHGSTLSIWNVLDESAELLHYSTVLAHDKLVMDAVPAAAAPSSWWSLLSGAEQLYPGYIQDIAISPDSTLVALRDSSGHVSIRQVL